MCLDFRVAQVATLLIDPLLSIAWGERPKLRLRWKKGPRGGPNDHPWPPLHKRPR